MKRRGGGLKAEEMMLMMMRMMRRRIGELRGDGRSLIYPEMCCSWS